MPAADPSRPPPVCWVDGRVIARGDPALRVDDASFLYGLGCYTTALIHRGSVVWRDRHVQRLSRDAAALGLGEVDSTEAARALALLARAAFGEGNGAVRLQATREASGPARLVGIPRWLGDEPPAWTAIVSTIAHPGAQDFSGAKVAGQPFYVLAREQARGRGADEAILFDRHGYLIEGTRSNLIVVDAEGVLTTPDLARGGVAGVARAVVRERVPELKVRNLGRAELRSARELIAINALRGARAVTRLDDAPVADGREGPWARRLSTLLAPT